MTRFDMPSTWVPTQRVESAREFLVLQHRKSGSRVRWLVNKYEPVCDGCHEFWPCPTIMVLGAKGE